MDLLKSEDNTLVHDPTPLGIQGSIKLIIPFNRTLSVSVVQLLYHTYRLHST
jgi:hypothetical protein